MCTTASFTFYSCLQTGIAALACRSCTVSFIIKRLTLDGCSNLYLTVICFGRTPFFDTTPRSPQCHILGHGMGCPRDESHTELMGHTLDECPIVLALKGSLGRDPTPRDIHEKFKSLAPGLEAFVGRVIVHVIGISSSLGK